MTATPKATIVGGGLVGSLLAIYLARRGLASEVFERRPDMRRKDISAGRSINLAISTRGLHALAKVGLEQEILAHAVAMRGRMIHALSGEQSLQRYGKDDSECIHSISRGTLNKVLMSRAEETGRVRFHFERKTADFALGERVRFRDETGAHEAELLFATDGAASAVRTAMGGLPEHSEDASELDYGYKELTIPAEKGSVLDQHALHIWPRGTFMLIALPNFDGTFTCTLFLPFHGSESFSALPDQAAVRAFFQAQFADAVPLFSALEEEFFTHPTGRMVTVKCAPWNVGGRVLLLGDAAHAIVPFFGQGMNCGFEDVSLLDQAWGDAALAGADFSAEPARAALFSAFSLQRKPDADAIADMAVENFLEMRDKVADPRFVLAKDVEKILQRQFPGAYVSRYAMVTFSRIPYRVAALAGQRQEAILAELCRGLTRADAVDLVRAEALIARELTPVVRDHLAR